MPGPNRIFRQAALDRLASPEQLDQLMQVATPKSKLALAACCVLLLLAVLWSILGVIPKKVSGPGILINQGGVFVTTARSGGSVSNILVRVGRTVTSNEVLATLRLPELDLRIQQGTAAQARLQQERDLMIEYQAREAEGEKQAQAKQTETYQDMIVDFQEQIKALELRVENIEDLLRDPNAAVSKVHRLETQNSLFLAQHELARTQIQMKQIKLNELQAEERRRQERSANEVLLLQGQQELEFLTRLHQLNSEIRSPFQGTVLDIMIKPGQLINADTPIISLQKDRERLEARLYLPPADGKRVQPGMEVTLAPVSAKKERFGLMLGTVLDVSPFPARPESMLRMLENPTLVEEFSRQGAPMAVVVRLSTDPDTYSGFSWTSGKGPKLKITSGTLCEGTITLTNHRPISLVLPLFKETVGF